MAKSSLAYVLLRLASMKNEILIERCGLALLRITELVYERSLIQDFMPAKLILFLLSSFFHKDGAHIPMIKILDVLLEDKSLQAFE
jgi:hypothetical protein